MYKHILLAYDGSLLSDKALNEAASLAKCAGAKVTVIYVATPHHLLLGGGREVPGLKRLEQQYAEEIDREARQTLDLARQRIAGTGVEADALLDHGKAPHENLVQAALRLKCDLIVMASHGRRGVEGLVVGSQTMKVLTHTSLPVLVVR